MTYYLNPDVEKIKSPILLVFPDGEIKSFNDGEELRKEIFDVKYNITSVEAVNSQVILSVKEQEPPDVNWCGEEMISLFD